MKETDLEAVGLQHVSKRFGSHQAVDDLSLSVPEGSVYGFIGPNGSGKTTTIRMILHIISVDAGAIEVLGSASTRANSNQVGYLPEERGLYKKMTVRRQLAYYASLKGMTARAAHLAIDDWLERFELSPWGHRKIEALSKGMAQKIQFISAAIAKPKLLILDEPFTGLDPVNLEVLRKAILQLNKQGTTVIFSTHDMAMAERLCDFIFMIYEGRKVLDGTLETIQQQYGEDTVRLEIDGDSRFLEGLPEVERILDQGNYQEVTPSGDPQALLKALVQKTRVKRFELARPSLHDIFLRIAGPEAQEGQAP